MTLVVDASVATKWVLPEEGADRAAALRETGEELIAPTLLVAEIGSAVWKHARRKQFSIPEAVRAVEIASGLMTRLVSLDELSARAVELAIDLDHPIHDCFYLALAERERAPLVSMDRRLIAAAKAMKRIEVRAL